MNERTGRVGLYAALGVGAWLRLHELGRESLWLDELFSVRAATRESLRGLVEEVHGDVHPPLYFLALRAWIAVAGEGDAAMRALSVLAGVLGIWAVHALARRLFDVPTAVGAAWLLAVAPFAVDLDREARANAWLSALATASSALLAGPSTRVRALAYGGVAAAMAWTHPFGLAVIAAHGLWLLSDGLAGDGDARRARGWIAGCLAAGLLFTPWVPALTAQSAAFAATPWYTPPAPDALAWLLPSLAGGAGPLAVLTGGLLLLYARGEPGRGGRLVVAGLLGLVVLPAFVSLAVAPILRDRNVLPLLPLLAVGASAGLVRVPGVGGGLLATGVAVCGLVTWGNLGEARKEAWRDAAAVVAAGWQAGDRVDANYVNLWRHYLPQVSDGGAERGRTWVVRAHSDLETTGPGAAGELVDEWWFRGAHVVLRDPTARRVPLGEDLGPPMWDGTTLHYYWNQSVRSPVVGDGGTCRVGVHGDGDVVDGVGPTLIVRLVVDGTATTAWTASLGGTPGWWWSEPVRTPPPAVEVEFTNDGTGVGAAGPATDRNARVLRVLLRCT